MTHAKTCAKTYNAYHNPSQDTRHVPRPLPWGLSPSPYHGAMTRAMAPPTMVLQPVPRHVTCDTCHYLCHNPYEDAKTYVHTPCEDACQEPYMTCIIACEMMRATTPYHSAMPQAKTCDACSHPCQAIRARHAMTHPMVARPVLRNVIRGHNHCHGAWPEKTQHVPPPVP